MTDDAFEAHLALHGFVSVRPLTRRNLLTAFNDRIGADVPKVFLHEGQELDFFRVPEMVRIDQYGPEAQRVAAARAIPGLNEIGCCDIAVLYVRAKS